MNKLKCPHCGNEQEVNPLVVAYTCKKCGKQLIIMQGKKK